MFIRCLPIAFLACASVMVNAFVPSVSTRRPDVEPVSKRSLESSVRSNENELQGAMATQVRPISVRVTGLTSLEDFLEFVDSAPPDSLSVIKFYANSCPLCRRIEMKYKKMAHYYQKAPIRFAEVEKTAHPELFSTLGIERFPFIQIYRNSQCVASHGTESEKTFGPIVNDTIQRELMMRPEDWDSFLTAFAEPIRQSSDKLETLRSILRDE